MKHLKKLVKKKAIENNLPDMEFKNLDASIAPHGKSVVDPKPKPFNTYTQWPIKPATKKPKKPITEDKGDCSESNSSDLMTPNKKLPIQKPIPSIVSYQEALNALLVAQFHYNMDFDGPLTSDHSRHKKLLKLAHKLNLQKCDTDFLEWMAYLNLFFMKTEWRLPVLRILPGKFRQVVAHLKQKFQQKQFVEEFWKSVEHITEEVCTEIVTRNINCLITQSPDATELNQLLDFALRFLGEVWNYFEGRNIIPLLDDEMDSIARVHMESLFTKFEKALVESAKDKFLSHPGQTLENLCASIPRFCQELKENKAYWKSFLQGYLIKIELYELIYSVWDYEISEAVKQIVTSSKETLIKVQFQEKYPVLAQNFDESRDISLFSLFQSLRKFANLTDKSGLPFVHVKGFLYSWFQDFVPQWIDVACYRAMIRIDRAVKTDNLQPINNGCKRSYSSTFTVDIFSAMETSWSELGWPNSEEAYSFAILTLKNFDRCIQFYAESICNRLKELDSENFLCFDGSDELYIAINNVEYVSQKVDAIVENLGIRKLLEKLYVMIHGNGKLPNGERSCTHSSIEQCMQTPPNMIQNWKDNVQRRISSCLLLNYDEQIAPLLHMFLETAASSPENERESDKLMHHLNGILQRMTAKLIASEYERVFPKIIAEKILECFLEFAHRNLHGAQSVKFFEQLEDMLRKLCELLMEKGVGELVRAREDEIQKLQETIRLYKISTEELIVEYLKERYEEQNISDRDSQEGMLTVIVDYAQETEILRVNILNASLLKSGNVNSFIKFKIYSNRSNTSDGKRRSHSSQVQRHTQYPLFQEIFNIKIPKSEVESGGFIQFWLNTGHFYNYKWKFAAEAFFPLDRVSMTSGDELSIQTQIKLPMTTPDDMTSHILDILDKRKDKTGSKFAETQRQRLSKP